MTPAHLHRAFVHAGLRTFLQATLPESQSQHHLLPENALQEALAMPTWGWNTACQRLAEMAPRLVDPVGKLLADQELQLSEWFALALCGEVEASHAVVMALQELQAPDADPRPGLHLLDAMGRRLFGGAMPPLTWPTHPLVRAGILTVDGDGPLPMRRLAMPPALWALLSGNFAPWPGTQILSPQPEDLPQAFLSQVLAVADLVRRGHARTLLLRGPGAAARLAGVELARCLSRRALEVPAPLWEAQPALAAACRYGGWFPVVPLDLAPGAVYMPDRERLIQTPVLFLAGPDGALEAPDVLDLTLPSLSPSERREAWRRALPDGPAELASEQALLDGPTLRALAGRTYLEASAKGVAVAQEHFHAARMRFGTERLRLLAQPVTRRVGPDALVLTPDLASRFDALVARCRNRESLWEALGPSLADPSPGVRALFAGESGSGKTLAACRLATILGAPLFRLDLAAVLNKYIGESEKNLGRVLDEAAALDAILLIDEADALFGRRSDGKETGERYANMLTNFLLSRIEAHNGIVVLTTNARNRMDGAFTRRFDAVLEFPLPGLEERSRLWLSHLGGRSPDQAFCRRLASHCDLPGGHIRNAVLHAAALDPGSQGEPLAPEALVTALREEYRKLGRPLPPTLEHLKG